MARSFSHARREALAREKGFRSYREERAAVSYAKKSTDFAYLVGDVGGRNRQNLDMAKLYYQAFVQSDKNDYSVQTARGKPVVKMVGGKPKGARAKWLIDVAEYVDDTSEWRRRYPTGRRE